MQPSSTTKVWDPLVRVFHWLLVVGIAASWITHDISRDLHEPIGYATLVLIGIRLLWGFVGTHYARFRQFVKGPKRVVTYLADIAKGHEARYLGHNPAGAAMILALITCVLCVGVSGWLYTTDAFWGEEWLEALHEGLAVTLLVLVGLHVVGVIIASVRHRENLVLSMITGRKRAPDSHDIV